MTPLNTQTLAAMDAEHRAGMFIQSGFCGSQELTLALLTTFEAYFDPSRSASEKIAALALMQECFRRALQQGRAGFIKAAREGDEEKPSTLH